MNHRRVRVIAIVLAVCVLTGVLAAATFGPPVTGKAGGLAFFTQQAHATTYVYITRTGTKYHRHYCVDDHKHTRVTLHHAKYHHHLKPCKVCKPPK